MFTDSPATGAHWERQPVLSFDKVKLTNNPLDQNGHVSLSSLFTFKGVLRIVLNFLRAAER